MIKIKHRHTGKILKTVEADTLAGANLFRANLAGANLAGADLAGADLVRANLTGTVLDPINQPNGDTIEFEIITTRANHQWVVGYRTSDSPMVGGPGYRPGQYYEAPYFSTADTACHPGLYLRPHKEDGDITVYARPWDVHHAGDKYRAKWFCTR